MYAITFFIALTGKLDIWPTNCAVYFHYVAVLTHEEASSWVVAGDQAIFNISGVDVSKIR